MHTFEKKYLMVACFFTDCFFKHIWELAKILWMHHQNQQYRESQWFLLVYFWPVSTTQVRHDVTSVHDTNKECITTVVDTGEARLDNG